LGDTSKGRRCEKIGETYNFPDAGITGVVTAATVDEQNKQIIAAVSNDKEHVMLKVPMSDSDLAEWKEYGEAFFGRVPFRTSSHPTNEFELFEWLMETQKDVPREKLISWFPAGIPHLEKMTDQELRMAYCEGIVASLPKT
jgi:hypothetical protein